jgi:twitching motility protein PilT
VIKNLKEMELPSQITDIVKLNSGLLILAGPDNSGKTSTAAAFIEEINKHKKNYIITLEDPIEHVFINKESIVEQREIGRDVLSYLDGLEHCLNEDVDVVYVDEIKQDFDKAVPLILELASGNSLVIMEMNADNAIRALEKILNIQGRENSREAIRYNLADVLVGVVVQRLIPSRGGGMALAKEILVSNPPAKALIREGKIYQIENTLQISKGEGMISLRKSVENLVSDGKITQEEADKLNL